MKLGSFGVWVSVRTIGEGRLADAARCAEGLGFDVLWLGSSPRLSQLREVLAATETLIAATAIVNIWTYEPSALAAEYAELVGDFEDRVLVGIGVGHPEATTAYGRPLAAMRGFLDALDSARTPIPEDRRCLAALAPGMLELSRQRSAGAIPYFTPLAHTAAARTALGSEPLLAPEIAVVVDEETPRSRETARSYAASYLGMRNYASNLLRHGFEPRDLQDGGSDRLIESLVPHGSPDTIVPALQAHLSAGADHVAVQALGDSAIPERSWAAIADALRPQI